MAQASTPTIPAASKRKQALDLRKAGATYQQIADEVGYASAGRAHTEVMKAIAAIPRQSAKEVLALELERLDTMFLALMPKVRRGEPRAIDSALRVMDRRAKLLGLDDFEARLASVAERRVALEEAQALIVASVIQRILSRLQLTDAQLAMSGDIVQQELLAIEGDGPVPATVTGVAS